MFVAVTRSMGLFVSNAQYKITVYCQVQLQGFCFVVATTCRHQRRHHMKRIRTRALSLQSPAFYRAATAPPRPI